MSIEGEGQFFTIIFLGFVCFVLYKTNISGGRLQDHWSSGCTYSKFRYQVSVYRIVVKTGDNYSEPLVLWLYSGERCCCGLLVEERLSEAA